MSTAAITAPTMAPVAVATVPATTPATVFMAVAAPKARAAILLRMTIIISMAEIASPAMIGVEPGIRANKDAADKPLWPVVAIRRTLVWVIFVIPVQANWQRSYVDRAHADSDVERNALRMGRRWGYQARFLPTSATLLLTA